MVSTLFRDPQARSSALAALGTPQPRAFGSLNRVETLDSASNYYILGTHMVQDVPRSARRPQGSPFPDRSDCARTYARVRIWDLGRIRVPYT